MNGAAKPPLQIEYDAETDILRVDGRLFAGSLMRAFALPNPDVYYRLIAGDDGVLTVQQFFTNQGHVWAAVTLAKQFAERLRERCKESGLNGCLLVETTEAIAIVNGIETMDIAASRLHERIAELEKELAATRFRLASAKARIAEGVRQSLVPPPEPRP